MHIDLFIAPDGEFRHVTPETQSWTCWVEPVLRSAQLVDIDSIQPEALTIETKIFRRFRLMIPLSDLGERVIPMGPPHAWNRFLAGVIKTLEAQGDAPWKLKG